MRCKPLCRSHLIFPNEATRAVSREFDIVGRICIDKIVRLKLQQTDISTGESPILYGHLQHRKIVQVVDRLVTAEGRVECAAVIEAAKAVEASAIQIIKKLRGFRIAVFSHAYESVKAFAMAIKKLLVVAHLKPDLQAALHLNVKIYQMRIEIV